MRIALVADLHGNRPATEALERDLALTKPDRIVCLGDIVGKGPSNLFTYEWAFEHCQLVIGGNWDYGVGCRTFPRDHYYWDQLGPERLRCLRELPQETEFWFSGRRFRLFHGRPVMPELYTVADDRELLQSFLVDAKGVPYDGLLYADAHRQAMRTLSPGSSSTPAASATPWACPNAATPCWKAKKAAFQRRWKFGCASWITTGNRPSGTRKPPMACP